MNSIWIIWMREVEAPSKFGSVIRRLIINADDLGLVESVNRGIIETIERGVVTSTSLMVNMPGFDDAVASLRRIKDGPKRFGVGLHFNIVAGPSLTRCPTLQRRDGQFASLATLAGRALFAGIARIDVQQELDAQIEKARGVLTPLGLSLTHIDSHRHAHCFPVVYDVVVQTARRLKIPHVRRPYESGNLLANPLSIASRVALKTLLSRLEPYDDVAFTGFGVMASRTFERDIAGLIDRLPVGTTELMVHPGYDSAELGVIDPYRAPREREVTALTSPALCQRIQASGVQLSRFGD